MNRPELWDSNITIGTNSEFQALLRGTIYINNQLIARTQYIVLWGSYVHLGLEREALIIKNVATKYLLATWSQGFGHILWSSAAFASGNGIILRLIVGPHTGLCIVNGIVDSIVHTLFGYLLGIL